MRHQRALSTKVLILIIIVLVIAVVGLALKILMVPPSLSEVSDDNNSNNSWQWDKVSAKSFLEFLDSDSLDHYKNELYDVDAIDIKKDYQRSENGNIPIYTAKCSSELKAGWYYLRVIDVDEDGKIIRVINTDLSGWTAASSAIVRTSPFALTTADPSKVP